MFSNLIRFCKAFHDRLRRELEPQDIHRGQVRILHALRQKGTISQVDIANHLMLRRATVTRMLQRMERSGLIDRVRDDLDERVMQVKLTDAGEKAESFAISVRRQIESTMAEVLTPKERVEFLDYLNRVTQALQSRLDSSEYPNRSRGEDLHE